MNNFTFQSITKTTAEDQRNYFTGDEQNNNYENLGSHIELKPGRYRVIDGALCHIVEDADTSTVQQHFNEIKNKK